MPATVDAEPLYIVLNVGSGAGDAGRVRDVITRVLDEGRRRHEFLIVEDPAQIVTIARRAAQLADRHAGIVVVAGGDGTINAAVHAVLATERPFGIVPCGTFNFSSRAHGIPLDIAAAAQALLDPRVKLVQVGAVNDRVFLVNASVGLYPELLQDREEYKQRYGRKRVVALWAGLATLMREHRQLVLQIEHDGERELVRTPTLFVGNNPLQLARVGLPEAEDVQHRLLAGVVVRPVSTARLIWLGVRGALGQLGDARQVRDFPFAHMTVNPLGMPLRRGLKVALDGEICRMQPPLTFTVAPQPLRLLVPARASPT